MQPLTYGDGVVTASKQRGQRKKKGRAEALP